MEAALSLESIATVEILLLLPISTVVITMVLIDP
jgi:preprotein translocase subunit SecG